MSFVVFCFAELYSTTGRMRIQKRGLSLFLFEFPFISLIFDFFVIVNKEAVTFSFTLCLKGGMLSEF